jgi:predicted nucleotidyltransferase
MMNEIFPAIIDFSKKIRKIDTLIGAILYGSVVKGEMHKKSDIDILLIFNANHDPEKGVESDIVHEIAGEVEKNYKMKNPFSFVFLNYDEEMNSEFLWEVAKGGTILYAKPEILIHRKEWFKPWSLVSYSFKKVSLKDKMFIMRKLYGYKVERTYKDKRYVSEAQGIVNKYGEKIGRATFLIPADKSDDAINLFEKYGINYSIKRIWM